MLSNIKKLVLSLIAITVICFGSGYSILVYKGAFSGSSNHPNFGVTINTPVNNTPVIPTVPIEGNDSFNINEEKSVSAANVKNITIDIPVGDINFIPEKRTDIKANFHGSAVAGKNYVKPELMAKSDNNEVVIKVENKSTVKSQSNHFILDVYIPSDYSENIKASSSVGDISLNGLNPNKLDLTSSTGDIKLKKLKLSELSMHCGTGDIICEDIESKKTDFNCTTGSVKLNGILGNLTGKITTGDSNVSYSTFNNNVDISVSIGSIKLSIPKSSKFNIKAASSIGNLRCSFPIKITKSVTGAEAYGTVGADGNHINLRVSTGDIAVSY